jgi:hypothetical protein
VREHFGDRYGGLWFTSFAQPDESDQRLVIAVVEPTPDDRNFVDSLPYVQGRVDLVPSVYSEAQLQRYAAELRPLMTKSEDAPSVTGTGFGVRDNNLSANGQPVLFVSVTACDPALLHHITLLVPSDAMQVEIRAHLELQADVAEIADLN